jgi:glycosyltransferase involved in cell wall biosynthesis
MAPQPVRVGFVLHSMHVAGAEVLVAETIRRLAERIEAVVFCLDTVGPLGGRLVREGVPVLAFGRRPGFDFSVSKRMAREIRDRRVEVVHAHQYSPFFYGAIAARISGTRPQVIFTEHGRHFPDVVSTRRRIINRMVLDRLADHVNAVSTFSAKSLSRVDGFSKARIEVIPNGVDLPRYGRVGDIVSLRRHLFLDPSRRYITMVARLHPVKDHSTLFHAFAEIAPVRKDVDLLIVGDGTLREKLESLAEELGIDGRVQFLGVRNDVASLLAASDVFTLTSVSEAASITLLEAMASGLPVVVTNVGGNPEIVRDGVDGLLAPRGDSHAIAAALLRVLDDGRLAFSMGQSGAERVRTEFRLETTVERYYALYSASRAARLAA